MSTEDRAQTWQIGDLRSEVLDALEQGADGKRRLFGGRALTVKASPTLQNASHLAFGMSALPAGFHRPSHSHEAEEAALVVSGSGSATLNGVPYRLRPGTLLLTPSEVPHSIESDDSEPLVILWVYAPPGSEAELLRPEGRTEG